MFAGFKRSPRPWHFGIRATRLRPTIGWAVLGFGVMLGFELGYLELFGVGETNVDEVGEGSVGAAVLVALAVIVVAPVTEEFFFRGFFYRALRTRLAVWPAALIDGLVFGALHFQGTATAIILPVIAIHAAFNTVATLTIEPLPAIVIGALVIMACLVIPRSAGRRPSPLPA